MVRIARSYEFSHWRKTIRLHETWLRSEVSNRQRSKAPREEQDIAYFLRNASSASRSWAEVGCVLMACDLLFKVILMPFLSQPICPPLRQDPRWRFNASSRLLISRSLCFFAFVIWLSR